MLSLPPLSLSISFSLCMQFCIRKFTFIILFALSSHSLVVIVVAVIVVVVFFHCLVFWYYCYCVRYDKRLVYRLLYSLHSLFFLSPLSSHISLSLPLSLSFSGSFRLLLSASVTFSLTTHFCRHAWNAQTFLCWWHTYRILNKRLFPSFFLHYRVYMQDVQIFWRGGKFAMRLNARGFNGWMRLNVCATGKYVNYEHEASNTTKSLTNVLIYCSEFFVW